MEKAFSRLRQEAQSGGTSLDGEQAIGDGEGEEEASVSRSKGKRGSSTTKVKAGTNKKRKTRRANSREP